MNQINIKRMVLAGFAMFVMWIVIEILIEHVISRMLLGTTSAEMWQAVIDTSDWSAANAVVNTAVSILNCTVMIWLYASLRPMYGVGTKTALITSGFVVVWVFSLFVNFVNLGLFPLHLGLTEAIFEAIEFPIVMIIGASIYEGKSDDL